MPSTTYILQKHLPGVTKGVEFALRNDGYYYPTPMECDMRLHMNYVENNPEWFKPKEECGIVVLEIRVLASSRQGAEYSFQTNRPLLGQTFEAIKKSIEFVANGTSNMISDCIEKVHGKKYTEKDMRDAFANGRLIEEMHKFDFDHKKYFGYKWESVHDYLVKEGKLK